MKNFLSIVVLKLQINSLKLPLSVLLSIFLFMYFNNKNIFALFLSLLLIFVLIFNFKYLLLSIFIFSFAIFIFYIFKQEVLFEEIDDNFRIIDKTNMGPIIKYKGNKIFLKTYDNYNIKDVIHVKGIIKEIINTSDEFDMETYFKSKNIVNIIERPNIEIIKKSLDIRNLFQNYLEKGGENYEQITPLILLGTRNLNTREIYKMTLEMNIVHLFVISGFHLSLIFVSLNFVLKKMKFNENISLCISLLPVFIYLYFLYFSISAFRAFLFLFLNVINKIFNKKRFNSIQIFSFTLIFMFLLFPMSIYSLSFIFSFNATFFVLYVNSIKFKNKTMKYFSISFFAYLSNLIIIIYVNKYFSILGFVYSVALSPIIIIFYILHIFFFWLKPFINFIDYYFIWFFKIINKTNYKIQINDFKIKYIYLFYGILLSMFIILLLWNSYMEKKNILLNKKSKNL